MNFLYVYLAAGIKCVFLTGHWMKSSMTELPDEQDMLTEQEIDVSLTPSPLPTSLWRRMWRASITAVTYLLLYTLSQVTVSLQTLYTGIL